MGGATFYRGLYLWSIILCFPLFLIMPNAFSFILFPVMFFFQYPDEDDDKLPENIDSSFQKTTAFQYLPGSRMLVQVEILYREVRQHLQIEVPSAARAASGASVMQRGQGLSVSDANVVSHVGMMSIAEGRSN